MNPDLEKKISLYCGSYKGLKGENALAIVEYISSGIGFHHPSDPIVQPELDKAAQALKVPHYWIVKALERWRDDGLVPNMRFNQSLWDMERKSSNGDITDLLMSFQYGLTLERPRPIIIAADKLPFSNQWGGIIKTFALSEDAQIIFLLKKMEAVQATLGRADNFLVAFSSILRGEHHKVVSATPEAKALALIAARYRKAQEVIDKVVQVQQQTNANVLRGKSAGELDDDQADTQ